MATVALFKSLSAHFARAKASSLNGVGHEVWRSEESRQVQLAGGRHVRAPSDILKGVPGKCSFVVQLWQRQKSSGGNWRGCGCGGSTHADATVHIMHSCAFV